MREGHELIVAAGGDGTVNEVLNGIGEVPGAFARVRLGVLPLGTVNVLAYELGIPRSLPAACAVLESNRERVVDLPQIDFPETGAMRLFTQMAGFGWDARAVQLVDWPLKKRIGRFAYLWAAFKAASEPLPQITVSDGMRSLAGPYVLVGNGRFYAGRWSLCPEASWDDGLLEVTVFPRTTLPALLRSGFAVIINRLRSLGGVQFLRAPVLELTASTPVPIQADGEFVGTTPARCSVRPRALRLAVP